MTPPPAPVSKGMRGQWSNGQGKQQMCTPPPPAPAPSETISNSILLKPSKALTNTSIAEPEKERRSDSYSRVLKIVQHHYPVKSAWPPSYTQHVVEMAATGELLQNSGRLDTASLLFQGHTERHTHHRIRPRNLLHSVVETCRRTPCPQRRRRSAYSK